MSKVGAGFVELELSCCVLLRLERVLIVNRNYRITLKWLNMAQYGSIWLNRSQKHVARIIEMGPVPDAGALLMTLLCLPPRTARHVQPRNPRP